MKQRIVKALRTLLKRGLAGTPWPLEGYYLGPADQSIKALYFKEQTIYIYFRPAGRFEGSADFLLEKEATSGEVVQGLYDVDRFFTYLKERAKRCALSRLLLEFLYRNFPGFYPHNDYYVVAGAHLAEVEGAWIFELYGRSFLSLEVLEGGQVLVDQAGRDYIKVLGYYPESGELSV